MKKPKSTSRWVAILLGLWCGPTVGFPVSVPALENANVEVVSHPPAERGAQLREVVVFDNDLLDRLFGNSRAAEKARSEAASAADGRVPNLFEEAAPSSISPKRSLLAGITRKMSARRAAALRLAEKGRVLVQNRDYQKALYPLEQALGLDANPVIYFYLARTHYHLGNYDRASGFLQVAESLLAPQSEWLSEIITLRTAVSAAVAQRTVSRR